MTMPDNLPWLVGVLLFLLTTPTLISKWAADHLPGWTGATARWWRARKLRVAAEDRAERTEAILRALQVDYEAMQVELDEMVKEMAGLRSTVTKLDADLTQANRRLWASIGYIRKLADSLRQHAEVPEPPELLRDIL